MNRTKKGQATSTHAHDYSAKVKGHTTFYISYLPVVPPFTDSWLPASLGVLTDFEEGDIGVGTK